MFKGILDHVRDELTRRFTAPEHAHCTSSCPDCLRSYDNRRLHGALDWRLALDMLDLAAGRPLELPRWFDGAGTVIDGFVRLAEGDLVSHLAATVPIVVNRDARKAVVLGHPLWRRDEDYFTELQSEAWAEAADLVGGGPVSMSDLHELDRSPLEVLKELW